MTQMNDRLPISHIFTDGIKKQSVKIFSSAPIRDADKKEREKTTENFISCQHHGLSRLKDDTDER
jgi:hypothetical protein